MLNLDYSPLEVVDTEGMPNDEWLKYRTTGIGGSDVAAIYEVSGWTTKRALYYSKLGLDRTASNQFTLDFGHAVEPYLAKAFLAGFETKYKSWLEHRMGVKIKSFTIYKDTMMYRHPFYPFMQANLDYRFRLITEEEKVISGVFECKTTSYHIGPEKWDDNKVPYEYELQTRHYMSVMNEPYTIIACVWGNNENDYRVRLIERDMDLEEDLIEMEEDFWENNVLAKNPPELSHEHAEQELEAFHSYSIADRIKAGTLTELKTDNKRLLDAVKTYDKLQEKKSALKAKLDELEQEMTFAKVEILECVSTDSDEGGSFEGVIEPNPTTKYIIKNKISKRKGIDSARFKEELPDIYNEYIKESESARFTVTKLLY